MERTPVNPWSWSLNFGFHQAEIIKGHRRELICAGQTAMDADGTPQHEGDMRTQIGLALDNLEAVLAGAEMTFANIPPRAHDRVGGDCGRLTGTAVPFLG